MNYSIMIAAAFILATVAVATLSPFDHLPQGAPQEAAAPADGGDGSSDEDSASGGSSGSNIRGHWAAGEEPPP
jgi:hypothetical protein